MVYSILGLTVNGKYRDASKNWIVVLLVPIAQGMCIMGRCADPKAHHQKVVTADHGCSCTCLTLIRDADRVGMWEATRHNFPIKFLTK